MKRFSIIVFILITVSSSFGQTETTNQPKVIVFKPDGNSDQSNRAPEFKNMLKISPIMFFNGDFPIFFERRIGDNTSFEIAAGLTHKDYIHILSEEINDESSAYDDLTDYKYGKSLRLAFRYWPSKYGALDEGYYFSPELLYRKYTSELNYVNSYYNSTTNTSVDEIISTSLNRTIKEFRLIMGWVYYLDDDVFFEYFGGIGLSSISYEYTTTVGGNSVPTNTSKDKPNYILGWKIGFSF